MVRGSHCSLHCLTERFTSSLPRYFTVSLSHDFAVSPFHPSANPMSQRPRRNVALVTYEARPEVTDDDRLLAETLSARRVAVRAIPWSDRAARWSEYDAVVVRSCWDYFHRAGEFHAWLDHLEAGGAQVHNDVRILRWNADKVYL